MTVAAPKLYGTLAVLAFVIDVGRGKLLRGVVDPGDFECKTGLDARPGTPTLNALGDMALNQFNEIRAELGDRLVKAAEAVDAARSCGYFYSFGDYTWCDKAMPTETEYARQNRYPVHICQGQARKGIEDESDLRKLLEVASHDVEFGETIHQQREEVHERQSASEAGYLGLSYGIFTSDPWSELMSNMYHMPTVLHDCFYSGDEGPLANDMHTGFSEEEPCKGRHCYSVPYIGERVCIGQSRIHGGKRYEPLSQHLQGRGNLSTFIKMDVEGAEWSQLEQLLENDEDMMKIRTLDMEVHLNMDQEMRLKNFTSTDAKSQASLERKVQIMEKLAQKFAVTGSTLQPLFTKEKEEYDVKRSSEPNFQITEPLIYTSKGYGLPQYCISFMNRQLL